MRLLFLIRSLEIGGAERQLVELVRHLDKGQFEILVVPFYDGGALRPQVEAIPGVRVQSLGKASRWDLLSFFGKLLRLVRDYRPDVIQSYLDVPNSFNVLVGKLLGMKSVLGASASFVDFSRYDWTHRLVYQTGARLSHFSTLVIANSNAGQKYNVANGYSARKTIVIPNGIDTQTFQPDPAARDRIRQQWGLAAETPVVGLVGRLDPMKDHPNFLRAAALLARDFPAARFVCIGRGPENYRAEMQTLAETLLAPGQVLWVENCPDADLPGAYNAFDVLVSSSYGEGLPVVLGEGMACGTPCVVTAVGDSATAVGETGWVVPPKDSAALAAAIGGVLRLSPAERAAVSQQTRRRVLENFSIEKMTADYAATYTRLVNG